MKLNKIILVFLALVNTLFILPTSAEELPTLDVVQLEDGSIKITSEYQEVIDGFSSFVLNDGNQDVSLIAEKTGNSLIFEKPDLVGEVDYLFNYEADGTMLSISGKLLLKEAIIEKTFDLTDKPAINAVAKPNQPVAYYWFDEGKLYFYLECDYQPTAKFEILYSTKKNGKYKKMKLIGGGVMNYSDGVDNWEAGYQTFKTGNLKPLKTYYIKARTYLKDGKKKVYSSWLKGDLTLPVFRPTNFVIDLNNDNSMKMTWKEGKGAKLYDVDLVQLKPSFDQIFYDSLWDAYYDAAALADAAWFDVIDYEDTYLGTPAWDPVVYDNLLNILYDREDDMDDAFNDILRYEKRNLLYEYRTFTGTSADYSPSRVDTTKPFYAYLCGYVGDWTYLSDSTYVEAKPEVFTPVTNVTVSANDTGSEVIFGFDTTTDLNIYQPWRESGFVGLNQQKVGMALASQKGDTTATRERNHDRASFIKSIKIRKLNKKAVSGLDQWAGEECHMDFNLFVATSAAGPYTRVKTVAEFDDHNDLKLRYKTVATEKLYYKIIPTWDNVDLGYRPFGVEEVDMNNDEMNYSLNSHLPTITTEYTLKPGKPLNISGQAIGGKKVKISVDKGVSINGYELFNADTGTMIKRQKSNIFKFTAANLNPINYQVRCYRLSGKTKVYSDFSDIVSVTAYN